MGFDTMRSYERFMVNSVLRSAPVVEGAASDNIKRQDSCVFANSRRSSREIDRRLTPQQRPSSLSPAVPAFHSAKSHWSPPPSPGSTSPRTPSAEVCLPESSKSKDELANDLFMAACAGDLGGIQIALSQGAPIKSSVLVPGVFETFKPAKPGHLSPLAGAATYGQCDAIELLLACGAELNPCSSKYASSPLHQACRANDIRAVRLLLDRGADVNINNSYKVTPIMCAVKYGSLELVSLLLQHHPDIDRLSFIGAGAIHWSVWPGKPEVTTLLLKAGANPNLTMPDGNTALHCAVQTDCAPMVKCLLRHGANPLQRNDAYETPLQLANAASGNPQILAMLKAVVAMQMRR